MSDVAVVLRKARDLYAANPSHAAADMYPERDTHCPMTAIYRFTGGSWTKESEVAIYALCLAGEIPGTLLEWNAEVSTETVLAAFDKAITEADNA